MPALTASRASARLRASAFAGRSLRCSASNGATASMKALWLPGADTPKLNPSYLDGSLPGCVRVRGAPQGARYRSFAGRRRSNTATTPPPLTSVVSSSRSDFGFDPLGLASTPELLVRGSLRRSAISFRASPFRARFVAPRAHHSHAGALSRGGAHPLPVGDARGGGRHRGRGARLRRLDQRADAGAAGVCRGQREGRRSALRDTDTRDPCAHPIPPHRRTSARSCRGRPLT